MGEWGQDPRAGTVSILGTCGFYMFLMWKVLLGCRKEDVPFSCFKDYSVMPKDDTQFYMCMRHDPVGRTYLHIVPCSAITESGIDCNHNDEENT